jgi:LAO/AO transport system kinase
VLGLVTADTGAWTPPVLKTEATRGVGVSEVLEAIDRFRAQARSTIDRRRGERVQYRIRELLASAFLDRAGRRLAPGELEQLGRQVAERKVDPYSAVAGLLDKVCGAQE